MPHGTAPPAPSGARVLAFRAEEERQFTSEVGLTVFLGSWAMMFGALFFSYALLRARATAWPPPELPPLQMLLPSLATVAILASSAALHLGIVRLRRGLGGVPGCVATAVALGALFLASQVTTWLTLWEAGLRLSTGVFASVYYLLTVFHGVHVVVGLALLASLFPSLLAGAFTPASHVRARLVGRFWHFVGGAWVATFVSVYLL